jgi:uncharacterized iron-regulated protein
LKYLFKLTLFASFILAGLTPPSVAAQSCNAQVAQWLDPADGSVVAPAELFDRVAGKSIVLLGEVHDNPGHHRWQHYSMAALHSRHPNLVVGLEMLPRRVQPVLDDWSAGELEDAEFLERSEWEQLWGYDPELYLPLLRFARQHRLPTIALNIDRKLVSRVGAEGWDAIEKSARLGLSDPAPASAEYRRRLGELYAYKMSLRGHGDAAAEQDVDIEAVMQSEAFGNFVDAQLTWDRAMAEALADAERLDPEALIVGIVGRGHLEYGYGIPHQLADLGIDDVAVLLPVDADADCAELSTGLADAVFVVEARSGTAAAPRPRLGVMIENGEGGVRVMEVVADSVAAASGLREGDIIRRAAGFETMTTAALIEVIQRQAPGTWLPLAVQRSERELEIIARFPQSFE